MSNGWSATAAALAFTACARLAERAGLGQALLDEIGRYPTAAEVMARINAVNRLGQKPRGLPHEIGSGTVDRRWHDGGLHGGRRKRGTAA